MILNNSLSAIMELDLNPIKVKLMHVESGEGWSRDKADAVEKEYRRFLYLMTNFPSEQTSPQVDVDTFWHYHILDTMKYAADCEQAFGYFLHHFPYVGMRGEEDEAARHQGAERIRELYERTFGESYSQAAAAMEQSGSAFCGATGVTAAFCGATGAKSAFCGATGAKAAFCGATGAKAAFCGATGVKAAFCGATGAKPAFCGAVGKQSTSEVSNSAGFYTKRPELAVA
jgi:hypothetical protein